ncbi:unnamed protein product [Nippostrongylus brasiliensis]|uniref:Protein Skeletor n=1 Tax=Nippostrongylus brasiliensis TaxID=27835 RepID=A0A0N4XT22_NIPBR|nr:unnamed protein product [Nippostrongylus brasiliensis]
MSGALFLLTTLCYVHFSVASYCGQAAIPFTFQILHSGLPVLGCARPKCFGWDANGTRADETAQFYRINGKEDGYLRRSDQKSRSPFHSSTMTPRIAGQLVVGGEVMSGDTLEGFDYIADIKVEETKNGNRTVIITALPDYTQQLEQKPAVQQYQQQQLQQQQPQQQPQQQQFATLQQHNSLSSYPNVQPVNTVPATGVQPAASFYNPYYQLPPQVAQPFAAVPNQPNVNSFISLQPVPLAMQKQPQMQVQEREGGVTTSLPTLPPMTFPTLDQIPKIDIPSVEDVENVIPPVQRAILTTVARFFGVL